MPEHAHSDTKEEYEQFLTWCFNELSLDKPLEMIAFHFIEFILKSILYLYMNNKKSVTALYSLPSTEKSLFS